MGGIWIPESPGDRWIRLLARMLAPLLWGLVVLAVLAGAVLAVRAGCRETHKLAREVGGRE